MPDPARHRTRANALTAALAIGAVLATASCTAGAGSPTAAPPTSLAPTALDTASSQPLPGASPATSPAGSFPPADGFAFVGATPVITPALAGLPNERYVNPGAVLADASGTLHLFANLFSSWPGPVEVVHLTSSDAIHWTRVADVPALSSGALPFAKPGSDVSTGFVGSDGTWTLILESVSSIEPWQLYRATAPGPNGPWTVGPGPILAAGAAGSIDAGGLRWPSIVRDGPGYLMAYTAFASSTTPGVITTARSTDGVSWTRAGAPVLVADRPWEHAGLDRPRLVAAGGGFVMVYAGSPLTNRGEARSADGTSWQKLGDGPVIAKAMFPGGASGAWDCALLQVGDRLEYLLEVGSSSGGTAVYAITTP